jgi:hypothetical protein
LGLENEGDHEAVLKLVYVSHRNRP